MVLGRLRAERQQAIDVAAWLLALTTVATAASLMGPQRSALRGFMEVAPLAAASQFLIGGVLRAIVRRRLGRLPVASLEETATALASAVATALALLTWRVAFPAWGMGAAALFAAGMGAMALMLAARDVQKRRFIAGNAARKGLRRRRPITELLPLADSIADALSRSTAVAACMIGGSMRRREDAVGDIDIVAASMEPARVAQEFSAIVAALGVANVRAAATATIVGVESPDGIKISLVIVPPGAFGSAVIDHSGAAHCVSLRKHALLHGHKLSWGPRRRRMTLFVSLLYLWTTVPPANPNVLETEKEVYARLRLKWISPVARQGAGEVAAAARQFHNESTGKARPAPNASAPYGRLHRGREAD